MSDRSRATVAQLAEFDAIVDVRSPAEFAEDHIPGAINCPVLDDEERRRVGTLYVQVSPFEARKVGAVLVARNIARYVERRFGAMAKSWRPLIYCWRGGQRSGAFTHVLREIGWAAGRLDGGYKSWRRLVLEGVQTLPPALTFQVVAGPTGSAKSRLLDVLEARGAQVLHLEELASHKGSVLGALPDLAQPSQKMFETRLYQRLSTFDPARPVFTEAESRLIGRLRLPDSIIDAIRVARGINITSPLESRVDFLLGDYAYLCDAAKLNPYLDRLKELQGRERVARWQHLAVAGDFRTLVTELLAQHYDPHYTRSQQKNFSPCGQMRTYTTVDLTPAALESLADRVLADFPHSA